MSKNTLNILVVSASSLSLARKIRDEYPGKTVIYCRAVSYTHLTLPTTPYV